MKKGILIVATGSPYYGRMAFNLAMTIKAAEKEMPVAIVAGGDRVLSHLDFEQTQIFDHIISDPELENSGAGSKLMAYRHSPFDCTLLIDADNLWLPNRKPSEMMSELEGIGFTAITEGWYDLETKENKLNPTYPLWASVNDIASAWQIKRGRIYQWRSEAMYFEKGDTAKSLFNLAIKIFNQPKVKHVNWGGGVPDELAINISAALLGLSPHRFGWQPTWWIQKAAGRVMPLHMIMKGHDIFSTGGNNATPSVKKLYNQIAAVAHRKLGKQFLFLLQSKSHSLPERRKF